MRTGSGETSLDRSVARAQERWGAAGIVVDRAVFEAHLAACVTRVDAALRDRLQVEDLYFACACAAGDRAALAVFESEFVPTMRRAIGRLGLSAAASDDVLGALREKLFVAPVGRAPLMADYAGRGPLAAWLRALAAHAALKVLREQGRRSELTDSADEPMVDAELVRLRGDGAAAFDAAFRRGFAALPRAQRTLLRQHFLDGLTFEAIARLDGVHVSTAWRRVEAARLALVSAVRAELAAVLGAGESTVDGVVRAACDEASVISALRSTSTALVVDE